MIPHDWRFYRNPFERRHAGKLCKSCGQFVPIDEIDLWITVNQMDCPLYIDREGPWIVEYLPYHRLSDDDFQPCMYADNMRQAIEMCRNLFEEEPLRFKNISTNKILEP